jgi:hypothetical protein
VAANVLTFQVENIPGPVLAKGGNTLVVVGVTDSQSGDAIAGAAVTANGVSLAYADALKVYQGWLVVSTGDSVRLSVVVEGNTYQAVGGVPPTYPQIQSPRTPTAFVRMEDFDVANNAFVSWNGDLPGAGFAFAVAVLDETGDLAWPTRTSVQAIAPASPNSFEIPGRNIPSNFPYIATGLTQSIVIAGAAPGSLLTMGAYSGSMIYAPPVLPPATVTSLTISPAPVALIASQQLQLAATAFLVDRTGIPDASIRDVTNQVVWASSMPGVVSVNAHGRLTAISNGIATITAQWGGQFGSREVTVFQPGAVPADGDAYAYQMNASHTGQTTMSGPLSFPASPAWTVAFPERVSYPIITGSSVFVLAMQGLTAGNSGTSMYAFDLNSGSLLWGPVAVAATSSADFAYDHGVLVTIADCLMRGHNAATGAVLWSVDLSGPNVWSCGSVPTAHRGIAYAVGSGVESTVFAVDLIGGKTLWATPILGDGIAPSVTEDGVYVTGYLQAYKLDPYSGVVKWHYVGPGFGGGRLTAPVFDNHVYMRGPNQSPSLIFDAQTGVATGTFESYLVPAFSANSAYLLGLDGSLTATSLDAKSVLWNRTDPGVLRAAPIVINSSVITGTASGFVKAYDVGTGAEVWSAPAGAPFASADESNGGPVSGMAAAHGFLAVAAMNVLSVYKLKTP